MVDRLKLIGSDVVGYIYNRAPMPAPLARYQRNGSSAHPMDSDPQPETFRLSSPKQPPGRQKRSVL